MTILKKLVLLSVIIVLSACNSGNKSGDDSGADKFSVLSVNPQNNSIGVDRKASVRVLMSQKVNADDINSDIITIATSEGQKVPGEFVINDDQNTITFLPSEIMARRATYQVVVSENLSSASGEVLEDDFSWTFTTSDGSWSGIELVSENNPFATALARHVVLNEVGDGYAAWLQWNGSNYALWMSRYSNESHWAPSVRIANEFFQYSRPALAISNSGIGVIAWRDPEVGVESLRYRAITSDGQASDVQSIVEMSGEDNLGDQLTIKFFPNSETAIGVWSGTQGGASGIWSANYSPETGWSAPVLVYEELYINNLTLQVDAGGNAIVAWGAQTADGDAFKAVRLANGSGWGQAELLGENRLGHMVTNSNGDSVAVWLNPIEGEEYVIQARRFMTSTGWATQPVSGPQVKPSSIDIAVDSNGITTVVWCERSQDAMSTSIYSVRLDSLNQWSDQTLLSTESTSGDCTVGVVSDAYGNSIALWQILGSGAVARRYTAGRGWGEKYFTELNHLAGARMSMAMNNDGTAMIIGSIVGGNLYSYVFD